MRVKMKNTTKKNQKNQFLQEIRILILSREMNLESLEYFCAKTRTFLKWW